MKTQIVYYSKTGNTRAVAERVAAASDCGLDEILYDEDARTVHAGSAPADCDLVILMCPVWVFRLPAPMRLYLKQYGAGIRRYRLVVTCGGMGLFGCARDCRRILGVPPEKAMKLRARHIRNGEYGIEGIV